MFEYPLRPPASWLLMLTSEIGHSLVFSASYHTKVMKMKIISSFQHLYLTFVDVSNNFRDIGGRSRVQGGRNGYTLG